MVTIFRMMTRNLAPSCASLIFERRRRGAPAVGSNDHVVARLDEGEGGRRRRREAVGQQVKELEQVLPPRGAESRGEIRDLAARQVAGEAVQQCVAGRRASVAWVAAVRAPITRSYSPSCRPGAPRRPALMLAVAVENQDVFARSPGECRSSPRRRCPCCRMTRRPRAGRRAPGRSVSSASRRRRR